MKRTISLVGIVIILVSVSIVNAIPRSTEGISGHVFYPTDDATIRYNRDTPDGDTEYMSVRNMHGAPGTPGWEKDSLIKFDISSIPKGSKIYSAKLRLYYHHWHDNNPVGRELRIYRLIDDWSEETVHWFNQPQHVSSPTDASLVPATTGIWMEWDVTADVQDFINGGIPNYGWIIKDEMYWGDFNIPITYFTTKEYGAYTPYLVVETVDSGNNPPNKPDRPSGEMSGRVGGVYTYYSRSTDPDGDDIYYYIDWGDGSYSGWIGPYTSGSIVSASHTWITPGSYEIRVKAKDVHGAESEWSDPLPVSMPLFSFQHIGILIKPMVPDLLKSILNKFNIP